MGWIEKWFPRTGRCVIEGIRLAILNAILLAGGGMAIFLLFEAVDLLRKAGIPIPLPVWLVMVLLVMPYYVLMFQYGKAFGALCASKKPAAGFAVGLLGQLPSVLLLAVAINGELYRYISPQVWRVLFTMISMIAFVAPVMVGLGSLDQK
ncbi:hypothetical protein KVG29_09730 [Caldicoprobacter algeriensis]|uniref:hypothetical protein n=1 Tax=Caldicoprobacter algeriensis TaxID=699281 RepID=UPI00207A197A|nr:hypothetical protein [Caldicoprobacter algeriensis]MCM8901498.1 hypothetical protein [Caldicoprobacter algeriensis]